MTKEELQSALDAAIAAKNEFARLSKEQADKAVARALTKAAEDHQTQLAELQAKLQTLTAESEQAKADLIKNQAISDQIALEAEKITESTGLDDAAKVAAIRILIPHARGFGKAREKARLEAEAAAKQKEADDILAKAAAIEIETK